MSIQTTKKQFKCGIIVIIAILIMLSPIMAFASPNIGDTAIWRISHEEITPTCTYVDVRVYLYRTTAAGMGFTMFTIGYDPTVLANPRRTPDRLRFDSSLLTPGQIPSYNWMVSNGATEDELIGAFPNAVVNDAYYDGTLAFLLTLYDNGNGHVHGQNIVLLTWNQLVGHPGHMGSDIFVYIRFDIASGATVNYESFVRFTDHVRFMGGEDGHSFNPLDLIDGSVTIICNAPTLTVQSPVTINDDNLTATSNVGGTATGSISLSYTAPAGVTVSEAGGVITVTGERPDIGGTTINEAFTVEVTRGTLSQNLIVNVHLTPLTADPTLTVQSPVTINDDNLTATSNVGGTATGPITLDYTAPAGVTVSEADGVITVTGER
ncbi:MAG: hypothetical protein FWC96_08540, partial [Oscillospiraceae bacterium]|nr:hypothetical protein [Oscillospiraceae bacterium]